MFEWILSSSLLIAVVVLLRFALKGRISPRLQYGLWALVLVRLLVPLSFGDTAISVGNLAQKAADTQPARLVSALSEAELPKMSYRDAYDEVAREYAEKGIQIEDIPLEQYAETVDYEITRKMDGGLSVAAAAKIIWLCGMAFVGLWFVCANLRMSILLKKTRRPLQGEQRQLPVYVSDAVDTPCLFGLLRPTIYLTSEAAEDAQIAGHAVEHELTHYSHRDNIWAALRGVCLAVHWFNPLVWCAAVLSRNDAELACDEATILRLGEDERAAYGRTLIKLTCEKRPALLHTATTMTGSGKSIRERISLIVKKPKMAAYTLAAVILISVIAVGCTFTGAEQSNGPWTWARSVTVEDINAADVWNNDYDETSLSGEEIQELVNLLNQLERDDFVENTEWVGGTPVYGLRVETSGGVYNIVESIAPDGSLEMKYADAMWWIDSDTLAEFIRDLLTNAESQNLIAVEVDENIPQAVVNYAREHVQGMIDYYNELGGNPPEGRGGYTITRGKITGLEQMNTGTAGLSDGVELYRLEYRLLPDHPDHVTLAGGMAMEDGWITEWGSAGQPYLLLHYTHGGDETVWTPLCVTNTETIEVGYGTPEMVEEYGNPYTAAAMELYNDLILNPTPEGSGNSSGEEGDPAREVGISRMAALAVDDVKNISAFSDVEAAALVPLLNNAAEHRVEPAAEPMTFWDMTLYLSGGPDVYSSEDEAFHLYAGLEEGIVRVLYHGEDGNGEFFYLDDQSLYWFIRETYTREELIEEEAFDRYQDILRARSEQRVEESAQETGAEPFTGYEITSFYPAETFTQDNAVYEVYKWDVAFLADNLRRVVWAGGMWLDSQLRVRAYEENTYFVVRHLDGETSSDFFFWDLYFGPDEETGRENAHRTIINTFTAESQ